MHGQESLAVGGNRDRRLVFDEPIGGCEQHRTRGCIHYVERVVAVPLVYRGCRCCRGCSRTRCGVGSRAAAARASTASASTTAAASTGLEDDEIARKARVTDISHKGIAGLVVPGSPAHRRWRRRLCRCQGCSRLWQRVVVIKPGELFTTAGAAGTAALVLPGPPRLGPLESCSPPAPHLRLRPDCRALLLRRARQSLPRPAVQRLVREADRFRSVPRCAYCPKGRPGLRVNIRCLLSGNHNGQVSKSTLGDMYFDSTAWLRQVDHDEAMIRAGAHESDLGGRRATILARSARPTR